MKKIKVEILRKRRKRKERMNVRNIKESLREKTENKYKRKKED